MKRAIGTFLACASCFAAVLLATVARAQEPMVLDADCTVSVGNQTASVEPDGSFSVENVAVFQSRVTGLAPQLYRVRAACLRDGIMETGQSGFFSLEPGKTTFVAQVFPTQLDPIPFALRANTPKRMLFPGEPAQLQVEALFPLRSPEDVTLRSAGTTYLSTHPGLVTVTEDGVITGANTGTEAQTALIAILHEGNLTTLDILALAEVADADGDGLPNDYERLYGLDPFDASDARGDLDDDGIRNDAEFDLGTLPNNTDSDADGLSDAVDPEPLVPDERPPLAELLEPETGRTLIEGETLKLVGRATDDGRVELVELSVEGVSFGSRAGSTGTLDFTVPHGLAGLLFGLRATDAAGNVGFAEIAFPVTSDPETTAVGSVVDTDGLPVAGAEVVIEASAVRGEFFDFSEPRTASEGLWAHWVGSSPCPSPGPRPTPQGISPCPPCQRSWASSRPRSARGGWTDEHAALFGAKVEGYYNDPLSIVFWQEEHPLFNAQHPLDRLSWWRNTCFWDGARFSLVEGGEAVAGYTATPSASNAAVIVANDGRTVLFGGILGLYSGDRDRDGEIDGLAFAENVVRFLLGG